MQTKRALGRMLVVVSAAFAALACASCTDSIDSSVGIIGIPAGHENQGVTVLVGEELRIKLGNVGPATYESPPQISSTVLTFLGDDVVPPFTPAGPLQEFRFRAVRPGEAIVHFRRLLGDSLVSSVDDTVRVR